MKCGIREILFATLMLGLLAGTWFFVFKPSGEKQVARRAETEKRRKELADLKLLTAGVGDIERKTEELQQAIKFFESKLPQQKQIDQILKQVWQMAEANTLQTRTIKTLKSERFATYAEQPIQVSLSGNFRHGFHAFLRQLEGLDRIIRVTQMKLEKVPDRDGEVQAHLTLTIFFEPDADDAKLAEVH